jgi:hypothetical protein
LSEHAPTLIRRGREVERRRACLWAQPGPCRRRTDGIFSVGRYPDTPHNQRQTTDQQSVWRRFPHSGIQCTGYRLIHVSPCNLHHGNGAQCPYLNIPDNYSSSPFVSVFPGSSCQCGGRWAIHSCEFLPIRHSA